MKLKAKLLTCNRPTLHTGRIYPKAEMEKAVAEYSKSIDAGIALGELGIQGIDAINLSFASHKVTGLFFEGDDLYAEIELLDTEAGQTAKSMMETGVGRLSPVMYASIGAFVTNSDVITVTDVGIVKTAIIPNDDINTEQ